MLPLNKPYINRKSQPVQIEKFVYDNFKSKKFSVTFSTRQSLDLIYKQINQTIGSQTVFVSPLTCVDALYPIINNSHKIEFIDINPETLNMDENLIPNDIDIIQAIHFGGNPQNMDIIKSKKPMILIEDCAQALGSYYKKTPVGLFGEYATFSFMKNIYSFGGSLLLHSSNNISRKNKFNKEFGFLPTKYRILKRYLESKSTIKDNSAFRFLSNIMKLKPENTTPFLTGSLNNKNIILSIQNQLAVYDEIFSKRITNAQYLINRINNKNIILQKTTESSQTNYHRLYFTAKNNYAKNIISFLREQGIGANHLTQNLINPYQNKLDQNQYLKRFIVKGKIENYFYLHDRIFCIPISPALCKNELDYIADKVNLI
jgi:dTDP-4-amino-4,6-dideoxygalactose transaminase